PSSRMQFFYSKCLIYLLFIIYISEGLNIGYYRVKSTHWKNVYIVESVNSVRYGKPTDKDIYSNDPSTTLCLQILLSVHIDKVSELLANEYVVHIINISQLTPKKSQLKYTINQMIAMISLTLMNSMVSKEIFSIVKRLLLIISGLETNPGPVVNCGH